MRKFDPDKDYYRQLGVDEKATKEEIDRAYRQEARKHHPDGGGSEEAMKSLNEARDILSDPASREAYDNERRPRQPAYGSSSAFDPYAASKAGTLKIPVSDEDFVGLAMGAATCFGLGVPFLLLIEMQWVFFLWPLRVLSLGALVLGVLMAHSALKAKHRQLKKANSDYPRARFALNELVFWVLAVGGMGLLVLFLYVF